MRNYPVLMLSAADDVSRTSAAQFVGQCAAASFIPIFGDTTVAGSVKVQGSNDIPIGAPEQYTPGATTWCDIPNAVTTITSGVGSAIVIQSLCFQYVRAIFTQSIAGNTTVKVYASFLSV